MVEAAAERLTGAENVVWDLSVFYDGIDDPRIQEDIALLDHLADDFAARYKGRVAQMNAQEMLGAMQAHEAISDKAGRLSNFASLLYTTDTNNPQYGAFNQKITEAGAQINQKLVFFLLEWNALEDDLARKLLDDPAISAYRYYLDSQRRFKPYQLSESEERLLIDTNVTGSQAWVRYFTQVMGAMRFDLDGRKVTQEEVLSKGRHIDREVRRAAAGSLTTGLREREMDLTYIFNVLAADKASSDKRRRYPDWISSRNLSNKAPDRVVEALIEAVTSHYELVARHYRLKRALLGYDTLYEYDRYAPLPVKGSDKFYLWDEAKEIVLNAFYAFSPKVNEIAGRFFSENWIHAPVLPGKRGGAYAASTVLSAHPFVFVNYTGTANDVMTLAHELGHGMHMSLSAQMENLYALSTPLTTAEMASTFAEMLVFQDLIQREDNREAQLAMLVAKIEDTFATVFRQTAMNRFEDKLHRARRAEGELTTERLNEFWLETQRAMFGDSVTLTDDYGVWWSYVPHFLRTPGYVYAYAFGELLVLALYQLYLEQGASFVPQYIDLLAAGDSDYPDKLLARIGVDLNDPAFWNKGLAAIEELVSREEKLARELYPDKF